MNVNTLLPKQHPDLPDAYGIKIYFHGDSTPLDLEVSSHGIIDKVYQQQNIKREDGSDEIIHKVIGIATVPVLDYVTKDDILGSIPLSSIRYFEFDKRWSKVRAIHAEVEKGKK